MTFQPDILVLSSDSSRPLLVVEVKNAKSEALGSEEQLKSYMGRMNVPTGVVVTPQRFQIFRHSYSSHSPDAILKIAELPTNAVITMPHLTTQEWELERAVQTWLESLRAGTEAMPIAVRDVLEENILPAIYNGQIRAAEPRWRQ